MYEIKQNESAAAYRTIYFVATKTADDTGYTSNLLSSEIKLSKAGGSEASASNGSTHIANGMHKLVLTPTELDTLGFLSIRLAQADCYGDLIPVKVVAFNAFDAAALGLSNLALDAILTAPNGVFVGRSVQRALQSMYAVLVGKTAGRGSATEQFYNPGDGADLVVTHTFESDGDRNTPTEA